LVLLKKPHLRVTNMAPLNRMEKVAQLEPSVSRRGMLDGRVSRVAWETVEAANGVDMGVLELPAAWAGPIT